VKGQTGGRHGPGGVLTTLLSVLIAVVLWVVAINGHTFEVAMTVPLVRPMLPDSLVIVEGTFPDSIEVVFTGNGARVLVEQLAGRPAAAGVPFDSSGGLTELPALISHRVNPIDIIWEGRPFENLTMSTAGPGIVGYRIDRIDSRILPVRVIARGTVPARYYWRHTAPSDVLVTSAASTLDALDSISTEPVLPGQPDILLDIESGGAVIATDPPAVSTRLVRPVPISVLPGS
jgi:hypothetical protein